MAHRDSARELQLEEQLRQSQDKIRRLEERLKYSGASTPVSSLPSQSSSFSGDIQVNEFPRTPSDAVFQLSASPHPSPDQIVFGFADGDSVPRTAVSHPSAPAARSTLMPDPELPIRATRAAQPMKRARTDNHDGSSLRSERMAASRSGIPSSRAASAVPLSGPMALPSSPSDGFPHPGVSTAASAGPFAGPPVCGSMRFGPFREDMSLGLTREMDPAEYLMKVGTPDMILSEPRGLGGPGIAFAGELGTAETEPASYPNGFLSACGSLTSGPTLETTAMSRLNSHNPADNVSISGQLEMVRIQSQQSTQSYASQDAYEFARHANPDTVLGKRRPSELDADFMGMGAQLAQDYSYSAPAANAAGSHPYHAAAMMRSYSNASNISMASRRSWSGPRAPERLALPAA
ncbi:hypothetical protein VTK73DRAFT_4291 [Phialemonium thermophilum]|uniref:Uncharacterized protein n=1 Tax=Phialemonium thermophilum TaxID=223376 RepID=A0ABR3V9P0_9PEZI